MGYVDFQEPSTNDASECYIVICIPEEKRSVELLYMDRHFISGINRRKC